MTFDVTRRNVLKSVAGVAGAGVGISGLTESTRAVSMGKVDVAIHLSGRGNEHASYREDVEDAIDSLDEQLPLVDIEHDLGVSVDDHIDTDDEEASICEIEKALSAEGMLDSYDIHLIVFTGNPFEAAEMGGAGFNMWKVGTPSSKASAGKLEDTDPPFYRMNAPEREGETDGTNCEDVESEEDSDEGDYAFAFVNDIYVDNDFVDEMLEYIAEQAHYTGDAPDMEDLGDSEVLDILSPVNIPDFEYMLKNTVVHEMCHCMGANHNDGTIYKGDKIYNGPGSGLFGGFIPHHYKISPMCTWYVEELMHLVDDLPFQEQNMRSQSDLCDAANDTGDKHTLNLSDCTIESIREHFSCEIETVNLTVSEMDGPDGWGGYMARAAANCPWASYTWEFESAESPEIMPFMQGSANIQFEEPGNYTLKVNASYGDSYQNTTTTIPVREVDGQTEPTETPSTAEGETSDTAGSESGSSEKEESDSDGYGGSDRTPVDTPDKCIGNLCFD